MSSYYVISYLSPHTGAWVFFDTVEDLEKAEEMVEELIKHYGTAKYKLVMEEE